MPLNENCSVTKGWLQKACRFSIRNTLKVRYFVLSDIELRYYKHPTDTQPAGIIELKNFHSVHMQNSTPLYGFKIISEYKNQWTPTLYADSNEERNIWIRRIQATLNKIQSDMILYSPQDSSDATNSNQSSSFSGRRHSLHSHHHNHHHHSGMFDRWLDKFDLHDKRDDSNHNTINSNTSSKHSNHTNNSNNNNNNNNNSIYYNHNHKAASADNNYYSTRNSIDTPISQRSYDSFADDSIYSDTTMYDRTRTPPLQSMDSIMLSTPPPSTLSENTITKDSILCTSPPNYANLEMERVIYLSHTTNRRSKSNQFYSGPIIPLSPPPRR